MRLLNVWGGRPAFYDRNPITKSLNNTLSGTPPLNPPNVNIYTVPPARVAFVTWAMFYWWRQVAATILATATMEIDVQPAGGGVFVLANIFANDNTVNLQHIFSAPWNILLEPGDIITLSRADGSSGGTVEFDFRVHLIEFDA